MRLRRWGFVAFVFQIMILPSLAQNPPPTAPLVKQTFVSGTEGWQALGEIARADTAMDSGRSVLRFEYSVDKRFLNGLVYPLPEPGKFATAQAFRFSVKASEATTLAVVLEEEGGGRFLAPFFAPKNAWQAVALAPSDFLLARDSGDPVDPNGKLDLDKVRSVGFFDVAQVFLRGDETVARVLFGLTPGQRTLLLADFAVQTDPVARTAAFNIDGLARPQIGWIAVGGMDLKRTTAGPLATTSLEATYQIGPGKFTGMVRGIPGTLLAKAKALAFRAASLKTTRLMVQLEDDRGGKYQATIAVPGLKTPREIVLPLSDFRPADDNKGPATLEASRVKQMVLADVGGIVEGTEQSNTLWLAAFEAR